MERLQSGSCDRTNTDAANDKQESAGINTGKVFTTDHTDVERELWNPQVLVICRSCGKSNWLQSFFGHSQTGLEISALLCRECFDLAVVRHVKYADPHFIMAAYYVATMTPEGKSQYQMWRPSHPFVTMASRATFDRVQPALPPGFRKGKLWSGVIKRSRK